MVDSSPEGPRSDGESSAPLTDAIATDPSLLAPMTEHFYRAEVDRATTWRTRLDQTTNWAVVVMAAILTWAFTSPDNPHYVLLIGIQAILVFLFVEAQRYQEYDAWRFRVRLVQRAVFAVAYDPTNRVNGAWREQLSDELRDPSVHIALRMALGHRLKRVYFPLLTVLMGAWAIRVTVFDPELTWTEAAAIGEIPGLVVAGIMVVIYLLFGGLALWSVHESTKREFDDESTLR